MYSKIKKKISLPVYAYFYFLKFITALTCGAKPKIIYAKDKVDSKLYEVTIRYKTTSNAKGFFIETSPLFGLLSLLIIVIWQMHGVYWQIYSILGAYVFFTFDTWFFNLNTKVITKYYSSYTEKKNEKDGESEA